MSLSKKFIQLINYNYKYNRSFQFADKLIETKIIYVFKSKSNANKSQKDQSQFRKEALLFTSYYYINNSNLKSQSHKKYILDSEDHSNFKKSKKKSGFYDSFQTQFIQRPLPESSKNKLKKYLKKKNISKKKFLNLDSDSEIQIKKRTLKKKKTKKIVEKNKMKKILNDHQILIENRKNYLQACRFVDYKQINCSKINCYQTRKYLQIKKFISIVNSYSKEHDIIQSLTLQNIQILLKANKKKKILNNFDNLFKFWKKFCLNTNFSKEDILNLGPENMLFFEAFLLRKNYLKNIEWSPDVFNRIKQYTIKSNKSANLLLILKLCFKILFNQYTNYHYYYSNNIMNWLQKFKYENQKKMGFLHFLFSEHLSFESNNILDFDLDKNKCKNWNALQTYLKLFFKSKKVNKLLDSLEKKDSKLFKYLELIHLEQVEKKLMIKIKCLKDIFQRVDYSNEEVYFDWIRLIYNDILYNIKHKFPHSIIDIHKSLNCLLNERRKLGNKN